MAKVSIVIPNYNGEKYIDECMRALENQIEKDFDVFFVDNGSEDESLKFISKYTKKLDIKIIALDKNYGFDRAVNEGIKASECEYVILLNNDTHAGKNFVAKLLEAMESDVTIFSAQALLLQYNDRSLVDSAGDYFCGLGVGFSMGKDRKAINYRDKREIFSACAGAAIYRKSVFKEIGYFPEEFFAYLEDIDIGYRAKLFGYHNIIVPEARVLHVGSASSGSRHNAFKVKLSARNTILLMYRNFAPWQWVVNFIPIMLGITIKALYFAKKKLFKAYISGIFAAFPMFASIQRTTAADKKLDYAGLEKDLLINIIRRTGVLHD